MRRGQRTTEPSRPVGQHRPSSRPGTQVAAAAGEAVALAQSGEDLDVAYVLGLFQHYRVIAGQPAGRWRRRRPGAEGTAESDRAPLGGSPCRVEAALASGGEAGQDVSAQRLPPYRKLAASIWARPLGCSS
jgi:hypothetical protein